MRTENRTRRASYGGWYLVCVETKQFPRVTPVLVILTIVPVGAVLIDEYSLGDLAIFETCEYWLISHRRPCVIARRPIIEKAVPAVIDAARMKNVIFKIGRLA